jgi:hypothetical protein
MNLKRDTYAIVDLDHLKYNVELAHNEFKRPLMAVIKADAYGHGYKEVASFLKDIDYVEMFAVATLPEAIELRELGIDKGILILGAIPTSKKDIDLAIEIANIANGNETKLTKHLYYSFSESNVNVAIDIMNNNAMQYISDKNYKDVNNELSKLFSDLSKMPKRYREKFFEYAQLQLKNNMLECSYMYQYLKDKINR